MNMVINLSTVLMELGRGGNCFISKTFPPFQLSTLREAVRLRGHSASGGRALQVDSHTSKTSFFPPAVLELIFLFQSLCTDNLKINCLCT